MPRHKKNPENVVLSKKNFKLIPYHIKAEFSQGINCPEDVFSSKYPMLKVSILEIPDFNMYISTWNPEARYISNCCVSNGEYTRYNGRAIRDNISKAFILTPGFSLNTGICGDSVPSDINNFFENIISEFIEEDTEIETNGWSGDNCAAETKYGISVNKISKLLSKLNGIAMGRTSSYHAQNIKNITFEIKESDNVVDNDD